MGHNDCTGFQEVELPARLITKIQLAWLIGSRIGWGDEGMDSMTSEYLYPILLNRVSDQGYTNTLSDKKKKRLGNTSCGVWVYSWILGFISYVPCYSFIAFYAWIVCYNCHVWCLSIPVLSFECGKPVRVGPRWLLWAVRLGIETIPNNVSAFLWQQPLDDHLEPWLSVYSGQR